MTNLHLNLRNTQKNKIKLYLKTCEESSVLSYNY